MPDHAHNLDTAQLSYALGQLGGSWAGAILVAASDASAASKAAAVPIYRCDGTALSTV